MDINSNVRRLEQRHHLIDGKNVLNTPNVKGNLGVTRKHTGPKQAFGDLKNVMHNRSPQRNIMTPQFAVKTQKTSIPTPRSKPAAKKVDYKNFEEIWSEKSVLTWPEYEEKVKKGAEMEQKLLEEEFKNLKDEIRKKGRPEIDAVFAINKDILFPMDFDDLPSSLKAPMPDLPSVDLDGDDFLSW